MPKKTPVNRNLLDAVLEIDGEEYAVSSVTGNFALNKIPTARCLLGAGRDVITGRPAKIHRLFDVLGKKGRFRKARVLLRAAGKWKPDGKATWPEEVCIFEGYLAGLGYRKHRGALQVSADLLHWLSDLSSSSALSAQSHPSNPGNLAWRASFTGDSAAAIGPKIPTARNRAFFMATLTAGDELFSPLKVHEDFWTKSLQPLLKVVAQKTLTMPGAAHLCYGTNAKNDAAAAALDRMVVYPKVPLGLSRVEGISLIVAASIAKTIRRAMNDSSWTQTFWDKLINEFAAMFVFSVVPAIEKAYVVPFIAGLRSTWQKDIAAAEYAGLETSMLVQRPLRAVGIFGRMADNTGITGNVNPPTDAGLGGCWSPADENEGMLLFRQSPAWLANIPMVAHFAPRTLMGRVGGNARQPAGTSTTPVEKNKLAGDANGITPTVARSKATGLLDRMAHAIYAGEMLRGRYGVLQGKLRFDIAPGSTIAIEQRSDTHLAAALGDDALSQRLIASVARVTYTIDAEARQAATAFQLANIRTEIENGDERYSVASHPLYEGNLFTGAPLHGELLFP